MRYLRWMLIGLVLIGGGAAVSVLHAAEPATAWKPLWDGRTLAGWHKIGTGVWTIEDGAIIGRKEASDKDFGHLVSNAEVDDFTIRLKFKSLKGNSGLYFRVEEKGYSGVSGFQAEIEQGGLTGGLYETNDRAWVVKPPADLIQKTFLPNEWNRMMVDAHDNQITVHLNDVKVAQWQGNVGRRRGHLALQLHGGNDMLVMFKDIELRQD